MTPAEKIDNFRTQIEEVVKEAVQQSVAELRRRTPTRRVKTRRAIFGQSRGRGGIVGLRFSRKFPTAGTKTLSDLKTNWRAMRPVLNKFIRKRLTENLKG